MSSSAPTTLMPSYFIPHGAGPCFFMDWSPPDTWDKTATFLRSIADQLPQKPSAIVLISGHWEASQFSVTTGRRPSLIYDYGGFPPHTYQLEYHAPGDAALAAGIVSLLDQAGIESAGDPERGWDHGVFIPLKVAFPAADIPVVQLSLKRGLDPKAHLAVGQALAPLRAEGVLLIGSGMSFHNMRGYGDASFGPVSDQFDDWLTRAVEEVPDKRAEQLTQWRSAPSARLSHPREEHLVPLFVVAGASAARGSKVFSERVLETTISAFRFD